MDPLVIVDGRHFLHRFHIDHPRASLVIENPQQAGPLVTRFEEIWATRAPGYPVPFSAFEKTALHCNPERHSCPPRL